MTIEYKDSKRITMLSTDANITYNSSGNLTGTHTSDNTTVDGWLASNKDHIKVNSGHIKWDLARSSTNYAISYDLGSTISDEKWLLRFRATWDTIAACAGNEQYIGISNINSTNSTSANHDFLGCMISMWASNPDFRNTFANGSTLNGGGSASNWNSDPSRSVDTFYFVEIKRLSTTTFSISFSSTNSYNGDLASSGAQTCSADTKDLRYIYFGSENAGSTECGQDSLIDSIEFYDGYTTPTTVAKPTDVQDNSILVEKDTANRYWFSVESTSSPVSHSGGTSGTIDASGIDCNGSNPRGGWGQQVKTGHPLVGKSLKTLTVSTRFSLEPANRVDRDMTVKVFAGLNTATIRGTSDAISTSTLTTAGTYYEKTFTFATPVPISADDCILVCIDGITGTTRSWNCKIRDGTNEDNGKGYWVTFNSANFPPSNAVQTNRSMIYTATYVTVSPATWTMEPTLEYDLSTSTGWTTTGSNCSVNTSGQYLEGSSSTNNDRATKALGLTLSDTKFVVRQKMELTTVTTGGNGQLYFGYTDKDNSTTVLGNRDAIGITIRTGADFLQSYALNQAWQSSATLSTTPTATTYYLELIRNSATSYTLNLYSDSNYSVLVETKTNSISSSVNGLNHITIGGWDNSASGVITARFSDIQIYNGVNTVN